MKNLKSFKLIKKILGSLVVLSIAPVFVGICAASGECNSSIDPTFFSGFEAALIAELCVLGIMATIGLVVAFIVWCFNDGFDEYDY